jgi:hypothetical protein
MVSALLRPRPEEHFTEATGEAGGHGVASVCQLLAALCCTDDALDLLLFAPSECQVGIPSGGRRRDVGDVDQVGNGGEGCNLEASQRTKSTDPASAGAFFGVRAKPSPRLRRVALGLLSEAVARSCRVQVKLEQKRQIEDAAAAASAAPTDDSSAVEAPYRRLLRSALGITLASCRTTAPDGEPEIAESRKVPSQKVPTGRPNVSRRTRRPTRPR